MDPPAPNSPEMSDVVCVPLAPGRRLSRPAASTDEIETWSSTSPPLQVIPPSASSPPTTVKRFGADRAPCTTIEPPSTFVPFSEISTGAVASVARTRTPPEPTVQDSA